MIRRELEITVWLIKIRNNIFSSHVLAHPWRELELTVSLSSLIASSASSRFSNVTKPKPFALPVSRSVIILTEKQADKVLVEFFYCTITETLTVLFGVIFLINRFLYCGSICVLSPGLHVHEECSNSPFCEQNNMRAVNRTCERFCACDSHVCLSH